MTLLAERPRCPSAPPRQFCRIEDKYLIHRLQAEAFLTSTRELLELDPHAGPLGEYSVTSLYYDTPGLEILRSKLDRDLPRHRFKLRMRVYGDAFEPETPCQVEIKSKDDDGIVRKNRVELPLFEAYRLCSGQVPEDIGDVREIALALRVEFLVRRLALRPAIAVGYRRKAFVGRGKDRNVRITVDSNVRAHRPDVFDAAHSISVLPEDVRVLEVKYSDEMPAWVRASLSRAHCVSRRFSKYVCSSVALTERERARPTGS